LSFGLRWDPFDPPADKDKKAICFSSGAQSTRFPNAPEGILFGGEAGCPDAGFNKIGRLFAPRFGFAYGLGGDSRTVLRGGLGLAYQPPFLEALNNMVANPPFSPQVALSNTKFDDPYGYLGVVNPFPEKFGPRAGSPDDVFNSPVVVASYQTDWQPARAWNYNLTVERRLTGETLVRAAYIGARGSHLGFNTDVNFPGSLEDLVRGVRPNPRFGTMIQGQSAASSNYNALQLGVSSRSWRRLSFDAHYTWSKSIDEVSSLSDLDAMNVFNPLRPLADRAVSDFDVASRFVASFVWELPQPRISGIPGALLGGWQGSGVLSAQSGAPFSVVSNNNISDDFETNRNQVLAVLVGKPRLTSGGKGATVERWFDVSAFAPTPNNSFGSAPRNVLRGPGQFSLDLALAKTVHLRESLQLEYRAEFFNALNHANFHLPDPNVGRVGVPNPDFGRITGALDPRTIQMALRLRF
jgi:hypothetical protein